MPRDTVTAVAFGDPGNAAIALLDQGQRSRLLLAVSVAAQSARHATTRQQRSGVPFTRPHVALGLLGEIQQANARAVDDVLADPTVAACLFSFVRRLAQDVEREHAEPPMWVHQGALSCLAAAAALRSGVRCALRIPTHRGQLWLPSLGLTGRVSSGDWPVVGFECGPDGGVVHGDSGSVRLSATASEPIEGWTRLPRIHVGDEPDSPASVILDHISPYRDFRAFRDTAPASIDRWSTLLRETFAILRRDHPAAHRVVAAMVRAITPVEGRDGVEPLSASTADAPGLVVLSMPNDALTLAAALVHEARHQLLTSLEALVPLVSEPRTNPEPRYFAPWRADPRPVRGLLYGAHAFAGVTSFWQQRLHLDHGPPHDRATFEFTLHRWQLRVALAALRNATELTPVGAHVVATLVELSRSWRSEAVHGWAARLADLCCRDLWSQWRLAHMKVAEAEVARLAQQWRDGTALSTVLPTAGLVHARPDDRWNQRLSLARRLLAERTRLDQTDPTFPDGPDDEITGALSLGLADPGRSRLLVDRPELVTAVHSALRGLGDASPSADQVADWMRGSPRA